MESEKPVGPKNWVIFDSKPFYLWWLGLAWQRDYEALLRPIAVGEPWLTAAPGGQGARDTWPRQDAPATPHTHTLHTHTMSTASLFAFLPTHTENLEGSATLLPRCPNIDFILFSPLWYVSFPSQGENGPPTDLFSGSSLLTRVKYLIGWVDGYHPIHRS